MSVSLLETIVGCRLSDRDRHFIASRASQLGEGDLALSESTASGTSAALLASAIEYRDEVDSMDDGSDIEMFVTRFQKRDERNRFAREIGVQIRRERRRSQVA